jgi:hypothetical protein
MEEPSSLRRLDAPNMRRMLPIVHSPADPNAPDKIERSKGLPRWLRPYDLAPTLSGGCDKNHGRLHLQGFCRLPLVTNSRITRHGELCFAAFAGDLQQSLPRRAHRRDLVQAGRLGRTKQSAVAST